MRRIMKLATVGAMSVALVGGGASAALANGYGDYTNTETAVQCVASQEPTGAGLVLGLGLNLNLLSPYSCSANNVDIDE